MISKSLTTETIPLTKGEDGIIRVSGTRVTLDSIVGAFAEGATPEEIAQQYSSVPLADVYCVIAHYLRHMAEVETYLRERMRDRELVQTENEARWNPEGIRGRLIARRGTRS